MKQLYYATLLCIPFCLTGCLDNDASGSAPYIQSDSAALVLPAEAPDGGEVTTSFRVESNCSWGINVRQQDGTPADWITLSTLDRSNLSGAPESTEILVTSRNNPKNRLREATIVITSAECETRIALTQAELQYALAVVGDTERSVDGIGGEIRVGIACNTAWEAAIQPGGTADAELTAGSGFGDGELVVTFASNDAPRTRTATVVVSAEDCPDVEIVFTQQRGEPFIRFDEEMTRTVYGPLDTSARLYFRTNTSWSAEVAPESTISELRIENASGDSSSSWLDLTFAKSSLPEVQTATIVLHAEDAADATLTITQTGLVVTVDFKTQPFTENIQTATAAYANGQEFTLAGAGGYEYLFELGSADRFRYIGSTAMCVEFTKGWIRLPAVPGMRLTRVDVLPTNAAKNLRVCGGKGGTPVVSGGAQQTTAANVVLTWTLSDTKPATSYYIYTGSSNTRIQHIELVYEE